MQFCEVLPEQCPPANAVDASFGEIWRVVTQENCDLDDFKSHAALGLVRRPIVSECDFASCSLFVSKDIAYKLASRLPKPRFSRPYLAKLSIPNGAGMSLENKKTTHVHFWMFNGFNPLNAILTVEEV